LQRKRENVEKKEEVQRREDAPISWELMKMTLRRIIMTKKDDNDESGSPQEKEHLICARTPK